MKTSPSAVAKISEFEGTRLTPYNDLSGNATVGVGHLLHLGPLDGSEQSVTPEQSLALFADDLKDKAERWVDHCVAVPLSQDQYDALVSFTFNLGVGTLKKLLSETGLNSGHTYSRVPEYLLHFDHAKVGGVLEEIPGLKKRREWEASLWGA